MIKNQIFKAARKEGCNIPTKQLAAFLDAVLGKMVRMTTVTMMSMLTKMTKEGCNISTRQLAAFLDAVLGKAARKAAKSNPAAFLAVLLKMTKEGCNIPRTHLAAFLPILYRKGGFYGLES